MNHSNEGIWEPPLAGGKPRRLTHFTASRIFDFNWSFDHAATAGPRKSKQRSRFVE
jgi:hypothetical protein